MGQAPHGYLWFGVEVYTRDTNIIERMQALLAPEDTEGYATNEVIETFFGRPECEHLAFGYREGTLRLGIRGFMFGTGWDTTDLGDVLVNPSPEHVDLLADVIAELWGDAPAPRPQWRLSAEFG